MSAVEWCRKCHDQGVTEPAVLREVIARLRLMQIQRPTGTSRSDFLSGYHEAADLALRIAEGKHTIINCSNARCHSPVKDLHCWECDELDVNYDADHIRAYRLAADMIEEEQA